MRISIQQAAGLITAGVPVAIPTETVYGLAADAFNPQAVQKTFDLKGRPADNPLIVHISDLSQLTQLTDTITGDVKKLAETFWPGPLTVVLPKVSSVPDLVTGGLQTVAVRMPRHDLTLQLIRETGPLTAPSANRSGKPSPTRPEHVEQDFGKEFPVIDGGHSEIGLESTVLDLTSRPFTILRPGSISREMIEACLNKQVESGRDSGSSGQIKSPGVKYTHYKPEARVIWIDQPPDVLNPDTLYLLHSKAGHPESKNVIRFNGDFQKMAHQLYDQFRAADHSGYAQIAIEKIPENKKNPFLSPLQNRISKAVTE